MSSKPTSALLVTFLLLAGTAEACTQQSAQAMQPCDELFAQLSSGERQAITETKKQLPRHAAFVDKCGRFDVQRSAKALWESGDYARIQDAVTAAQEMELEWLQALDETGSQIA